MREIMDQIKEENDNLKHKLSNKSSVIKSLKEDQAENKKDLKEIERKYEHECRIVQSLKNELRALDAKCEAATAQLNNKEKRKQPNTKKKEILGSVHSTSPLTFCRPLFSSPRSI